MAYLPPKLQVGARVVILKLSVWLLFVYNLSEWVKYRQFCALWELKKCYSFVIPYFKQKYWQVGKQHFKVCWYPRSLESVEGRLIYPTIKGNFYSDSQPNPQYFFLMNVFNSQIKWNLIRWNRLLIKPVVSKLVFKYSTIIYILYINKVSQISNFVNS